MPLKHRTETLLITLLTIAILLTGFLAASLPALPMGIVPWALLFIVSLAYPLLLHPLFKKDRADYEFRWLHWIPSFILIGWLIFQILALVIPATAILSAMYSWAWLLPAISLSMLLILLFCSKVIRQWLKRTVIVLALFIPFMSLALLSSSGPHYEQNVQAALWQGDWGQKIQTGTSNLIAAITDSDSSNNAASSLNNSEAIKGSVSSASAINIANSSDPSEEKWRSFLRDYLSGNSSSSTSDITGSIDTDTTQNSSSNSSVHTVVIGQNSSVPTTLPASGLGWFAIIVALIAGYCSTLHRRQLRI